MKHCPRCRQDYADKFETCFACRGALAEGAIEPVAEVAHRQAAEDAAAKAIMAEARTRGVDVAVAAAGLVALVGLFMWANDPVLPVAERALVVLEEGRVRGFAAPGGGAVRTELERTRFQTDLGVALPGFETGRDMLVWYPIESEVVYRKRSPEIGQVEDRSGIVTVEVRPAREGPPALLQLLERVSREIDAAMASDPLLGIDPEELEGLDEEAVEALIAARSARAVHVPVRPRIQLLALARVPLRMAVPRFEVAKVLADAEAPFDPAALGRELAGELIFGFFQELGGWLVFSACGAVVFVWLSLKLSARG